MTSEDIRSELERQPFWPFRLHLVSGKEFDVRIPDNVFMLQNAVLVLQSTRSEEEPGYDIFALRNIERLEHRKE